MPSTSAKQHRFMEAIAHNSAFAKKAGVPQSVGKDFSNADKGKTFKKGGDMKESKAMVAKEMNFMKKKGAPKSMMKHEAEEAKGMKKGGMAKETMGPRGMGMDVEKGSNKLTKFGESAVQKKGHTKDRNLGDSGPTVKPQTMRFAKGGIAEDPAIERGERHLKHGEHAVQERGRTKAREFKMPGGSTTGMKRGGMPRFAEGGSVHNRADGIAKKGFTRGKYC